MKRLLPKTVAFVEQPDVVAVQFAFRHRLACGKRMRRAQVHDEGFKKQGSFDNSPAMDVGDQQSRIKAIIVQLVEKDGGLRFLDQQFHLGVFIDECLEEERQQVRGQGGDDSELELALKSFLFPCNDLRDSGGFLYRGAGLFDDELADGSGFDGFF